MSLCSIVLLVVRLRRLPTCPKRLMLTSVKVSGLCSVCLALVSCVVTQCWPWIWASGLARSVLLSRCDPLISLDPACPSWIRTVRVPRLISMIQEISLTAVTIDVLKSEC